MRLPTGQNNRRYTAVVPRLNGGLDRRSGIAHVADNAVWECENLWWREGTLRPRDGFYVSEEERVELPPGVLVHTYEEGDHRPLILVHGDGGLQAVRRHPTTGKAVRRWLLSRAATTHAFCVPAGGDWARRYSMLVFAEGHIWGAELATADWRELTEVYVPLALTDAIPHPQKTGACTGIRYENANRLTPWFRSEFRCDGAGSYFRLPFAPLTGEVELTWEWNEKTLHGVIAAGDTFTILDGEFEAHIDRETGWFWINFVGFAPEPLPASERCNLHIKACRAVDDDERQTVFSAESACWFGGKREGIAGERRLFLGCGSQLVWSAAENPLYFPVENVSTVGRSVETITALHRQGERLVIFKERELYSLENELVTDKAYPCHTAVFPITPLDGQRGCDLPQTIALRGNRLTWACSDGVVYTLSAFGSLTQPSLTRLSAPIEPLLQQNGAPTRASALVEQGVYWLQWDAQLFVLSEDASPVWYRFTLPRTGLTYERLFSLSGRWRFVATFPTTDGTSLFLVRLHGTEDCCVRETGGELSYFRKPIPTAFCTKSYDMGNPETAKEVLAVAVEVQTPSAVQFTCLTERGEVYRVEMPPPADGLIRFFPAVWRCRRLAVRVAGDAVCVNSLSIQLRGGMT